MESKLRDLVGDNVHSIHSAYVLYKDGKTIGVNLRHSESRIALDVSLDLSIDDVAAVILFGVDGSISVPFLSALDGAAIYVSVHVPGITGKMISLRARCKKVNIRQCTSRGADENGECAEDGNYEYCYIESGGQRYCRRCRIN